MPLGSINVTPSVEEGILRNCYRRDAAIANSWQERWSWLVDETRDFQKELMAKSPPPEKDPEHRTIKPVPITTSGFVGYISSKPEFRLEKYGPDLMPQLPLPELYNLKTEIFKYVIRTTKLNEIWPSEWGWLLDESQKLRDEINIAFKKQEDVFGKTTKPIPPTTNGLYGWLANKPGFNLENVHAEKWYEASLRKVDQRVLEEFYS